jgi:hypothetical protein
MTRLSADKVNVDDIATYSLGFELIPVERLVWDTQRRWGQIRPISKSLVEHYVRQLDANKPREPVGVLVRDLGKGLPPIRDQSSSSFFLQMGCMLYWAASTLQLQFDPNGRRSRRATSPPRCYLSPRGL